MVIVLTFGEMRKAEERIIKENLETALDLMEKAGKNSYQIIKSSILGGYPSLSERGTCPAVKDSSGRSKVLIFCGKGNNAGDGFTIARYLANEGVIVEVLLL